MSINVGSFRPAVKFGSNPKMNISSLDNPAPPPHLDTIGKQRVAADKVLLNPGEWQAVSDAQKAGDLKKAADIISQGRPRG